MPVTLDIEKGDTLLGGRFKNHKTVVETLGTDSLGQPTVNGMKLLSFRIAKKMPKEASVNKAYALGFMDKCAELGIDPEALVKASQIAPDSAGFAKNFDPPPPKSIAKGPKMTRRQFDLRNKKPAGK
jgi:hypothetical protein